MRLSPGRAVLRLVGIVLAPGLRLLDPPLRLLLVDAVEPGRGLHGAVERHRAPQAQAHGAALRRVLGAGGHDDGLQRGAVHERDAGPPALGGGAEGAQRREQGALVGRAGGRVQRVQLGEDLGAEGPLDDALLALGHGGGQQPRREVAPVDAREHVVQQSLLHGGRLGVEAAEHGVDTLEPVGGEVGGYAAGRDL